MNEAKQSQITLSQPMVQFAILIIGAVAGGAYNAYNIAEKLATKPYVDERFEVAKRYTDDKFAQAIERSDQNLSKSIDHSDRNFQNMRLIQEQQSSDIKSQNVKLDMLLNRLETTRKR